MLTAEDNQEEPAMQTLALGYVLLGLTVAFIVAMIARDVWTCWVNPFWTQKF